MRLSLSKLRCDHERWKVLTEILKELKTDEVWLECKDHELVLYCHRLYGKYRPSDHPTYAVLRIPYIAKDFGPVFTLAYDLREAEVKKNSLEFPISIQRPRWADRLPTQYKKMRRIEYDPRELMDALSYVMRVPDCTKYPDSSKANGIILEADRMTRTDGNSLHIKTALPSLSDDYRLLLSSKAGRCLRRALKKLGIQKAQALFKQGKKDPPFGTIVYELETDDELSIHIGCQLKVPPIDTKKAWLPIEPQSICITVDQPFLMSVCTYINQQTPCNEVNWVKFSMLDKQHLHYEGVNIPEDIPRTGSILIQSVYNFSPLEFNLDALLVKRAIYGDSKQTQFVLPPHPIDGFKNYHVNPIYINSEEADRFAIIAPIASLHEDRKIALEREIGPSIQPV